MKRFELAFVIGVVSAVLGWCQGTSFPGQPVISIPAYPFTFAGTSTTVLGTAHGFNPGVPVTVTCQDTSNTPPLMVIPVVTQNHTTGDLSISTSTSGPFACAVIGSGTGAVGGWSYSGGTSSLSGNASVTGSLSVGNTVATFQCGGTDDTATVQAAIDTGKILVWPQATCAVTHLTASAPQNWECHGTTIKQVATQAATLITLTSAALSTSGCNFDLNGTNQTDKHAGVLMTGIPAGSTAKIVDSTFKNIKSVALMATGVAGDLLVDRSTFSDFVAIATGVTFPDIPGGVYVLGGTGNVKVTHSKFFGPTVTGGSEDKNPLGFMAAGTNATTLLASVEVSDSLFDQLGTDANPAASAEVYDFANSVLFANNIITRPSSSALVAENSNSVSITGNVVTGHAWNHSSTVISVQNHTRTPGVSYYGCKVANNTIYDFSQATLSAGIYLSMGAESGDPVTSCAVDENNIQLGRTGIAAAGAGTITAHGNHISRLTGNTVNGGGFNFANFTGWVGITGGYISTAGNMYGVYAAAGNEALDLTIKGVHFDANATNHIKTLATIHSLIASGNKFTGSLAAPIAATTTLSLMDLNNYSDADATSLGLSSKGASAAVVIGDRSSTNSWILYSTSTALRAFQGSTDYMKIDVPNLKTTFATALSSNGGGSVPAAQKYTVTKTAGNWVVSGQSNVAAAAAGSQTLTWLTAPANSVLVEKTRLKTAVACTAGPTTIQVTGLGTTASATEFASGLTYDLMAAVSNTNVLWVTPTTPNNTAAATNFSVTITTSGGGTPNVSDIPDGCSFAIQAKWAVMP